MRIKKIIAAEIILILATVLIFRSAWLLIDELPLTHEVFTLSVSLAFGIILAALVLRYIKK